LGAVVSLPSRCQLVFLPVPEDGQEDELTTRDPVAERRARRASLDLRCSLSIYSLTRWETNEDV